MSEKRQISYCVMQQDVPQYLVCRIPCAEYPTAIADRNNYVRYQVLCQQAMYHVKYSVFMKTAIGYQDMQVRMKPKYIPEGLYDGVLEGINSLIQAAKARARGYRTKRNLITMIYLIAGKLKFDLPT
jgi:hypothetical protein